MRWKEELQSEVCVPLFFVYVYIHTHRYNSEALLQAMTKTASLHGPNVPLEVSRESDTHPIVCVCHCKSQRKKNK